METALMKLARGFTVQSDLRPAPSEAALTQRPSLRTSLGVSSRLCCWVVAAGFGISGPVLQSCLCQFLAMGPQDVASAL